MSCLFHSSGFCVVLDFGPLPVGQAAQSVGLMYGKTKKKSLKLLTRIYLKVGFPISVFFFSGCENVYVHGEKPDTINSNLQRIVSMILRKKTFYISSELF